MRGPGYHDSLSLGLSAAAVAATAVVVVTAAAAAEAVAAPAKEDDDQNEDPKTAVVAVVAEHGSFLSPRSVFFLCASRGPDGSPFADAGFALLTPSYVFCSRPVTVI